MESTGFLSGYAGKGLEPSQAHDLVAFFEIGMAGFDDFAEAESAHDLAELDGRHVLRDVSHPDAHGRVDGKILDAREGLAVFKRGKRRFFELKDVGSNETVRTGGENPLTICVGHGKEDSRKAGTGECRLVLVKIASTSSVVLKRAESRNARVGGGVV